MENKELLIRLTKMSEQIQHPDKSINWRTDGKLRLMAAYEENKANEWLEIIQEIIDAI